MLLTNLQINFVEKLLRKIFSEQLNWSSCGKERSTQKHFMRGVRARGNIIAIRALCIDVPSLSINVDEDPVESSGFINFDRVVSYTTEEQ